MKPVINSCGDSFIYMHLAQVEFFRLVEAALDILFKADESNTLPDLSQYSK